MMRSPITWYAKPSSRCPICGGKEKCSATADGLYFCWRTHSDIPGWIHFKDSDNGFGVLRSTSDDLPRPSRNGHAGCAGHGGIAGPQAKAKEDPPLQAILDAAKAGPEELRQLADMLGVSLAALQALGVGYEPQASERDPEHWLIPERDAGGKIIGLTRRYANGVKRQYPGSKRGLTFDPTMPLASTTMPLASTMVTHKSTILVPEGASDVAAALTMGLCAVGRPNNLGGVELLRQLLRPAGEMLWPVGGGEEKKVLAATSAVAASTAATSAEATVATSAATIVIMAERDQKPDGSWPGMDGAVRTAQRLADAWNEPVAYALPPDGQKDIRSWLVAQLAAQNVNLDDQATLHQLGQKFIDYVQKNTFLCFPSTGQDSSNYENCEDNLQDSHRSETTEQKLSELSDSDCSLSSLYSLGNLADCLHNTYSCSFSCEQTDSNFGPSANEVFYQGTHRRRCPYHRVPVLQSIDNSYHGLVRGVPCGQHACRCCGTKLRSAWLTHITGKFLDTAAPLFCWRGDAAQEWKKARNQLRYRKANYAAVYTTDNKITVLSTVSLDGSAELPPFGAAEPFAEALLHIASRRKPIVTSRDWARHEPDNKSDKYRRVGVAPEGSFPTVIRQLQADHIEPTVRPTPRGEKGSFVLPEDWPEERTTPYLAGLGWGLDPQGDRDQGDGPQEVSNADE
jgi:hypothetical protein